MVDRIKQIIEYSQLSTTAFADTIGISRSGMTHLLTGRNQPSLDVARKILAKYPEVSTEWLIMGMGEMFRSDNQDVQTENPSSEAKSDIQHPSENSKMNQQTDLFEEYESLDDSEEDVPDPRRPQADAGIYADNVPQETMAPQQLPAADTVPVPHQTTRVRTKPAPIQNKREKGGNNVQEKKLQKIVFFYDDHSFEVFYN